MSRSRLQAATEPEPLGSADIGEFELLTTFDAADDRICNIWGHWERPAPSNLSESMRKLKHKLGAVFWLGTQYI